MGTKKCNLVNATKQRLIVPKDARDIKPSRHSAWLHDSWGRLAKWSGMMETALRYLCNVSGSGTKTNRDG